MVRSNGTTLLLSKLHSLKLDMLVRIASAVARSDKNTSQVSLGVSNYRKRTYLTFR
jgi:hypothetical protein